MNLICPLCGAKNSAIELWHDPEELNYDRVYCCLNTIGGNTRCEALFTVNLHGDHLERGLTEAELSKLPPRPRLLPPPPGDDRLTAHQLATVLLATPDLPVTVWDAEKCCEALIGGLDVKTDRVHIEAGVAWQRSNS